MEYNVIRSNRKTLSIRITSHGQVEIRAPHYVSDEYIRKFAESNRQWVAEKLSHISPLPPFTQAELQQFSAGLKILLPKRLTEYAKMLGVTYNRVAIRSQHTRWGSCSSKGNLNFNCVLALVPPDVLDYVVVHELCHLRELNHSPRFWALVESVLPDYRLRRKWLEEHGKELISRLP